MPNYAIDIVTPTLVIEVLDSPIQTIEIPTGLPGRQGVDGHGVLAGGVTGQVYAKASNTDFDTTWQTLAGTGDMVAALYDPQSIQDDAFDRANHTGTQPMESIDGLATALGGYQPLDADLTALAGLTATGGFAKRTAADTWSIALPSASDVGADVAGAAASAISAHNSAFVHSDIAANTAARHSHTNKATLDSIAAPGTPSGKFLSDDGSWKTVTSGGGSTQAFGSIAVSGQSSIVADEAPDTLTLVAGTNIQLTTGAETDSLTIAAVHDHSGVYEPADPDLAALAALTATGGYAKRTAANTWSIATPTAADVGAQPLDADLTAIAALSGTGGYAKRTAADTWSIATPSAADVGAQPVDATLTALAGATTGADVLVYFTGTDTVGTTTLTTAGRALIDDSDAAAQRSTLGLGDSATKSVGTTAGTVAAGDHAHSGTYQPLDGDLTAIAALSGTGGWAKRTAADTWSIATPTASDVGAQPVDATLTALAGVTTGADVLAYFTGTDAVGTTTLSAFARTVLDDADGPAVLATIGAAASGHTHAGVYQPLDADLTALAALSGTGGWAKRTAADTWSIATPTASDVGAQPLDADLTALAALTATGGYAKRTAADTWSIATPAAADVGAIAAPSSPQAGDLLVYVGSAWARLPASITATPSSGAVTVDLSTTVKTVKMTAESGQATTTITLTNGIPGMVYLFDLTQGAAGSNAWAFSPTLAYSADITGLPAPSTAAGKSDMLAVKVVTAGSVYRLIGYNRGF